jgi:hypothetical protein
MFPVSRIFKIKEERVELQNSARGKQGLDIGDIASFHAYPVDTHRS